MLLLEYLRVVVLRLRATIVNKVPRRSSRRRTCDVAVIILLEIVRDVESLEVLEIRFAFGLMIFAFGCSHAVVRDKKLEAPFDWSERENA